MAKEKKQSGTHSQSPSFNGSSRESRRSNPSPEWIDFADPQILKDAIFAVLADYVRKGKKPGAEHWQSDTRWKRPELCNDIRQAWMVVLNNDKVLFPWHEDFVNFVWVKSRKMKAQEKVDRCMQLGIDVPDQWLRKAQGQDAEYDEVDL
jgi:hypothetical protein